MKRVICMGNFYYCVICGKTLFPDQKICPRCVNYVTPVKSLHDSEYYREKSLRLFGDYTHGRQILIDEEVSKNPLYNPDTDVHNAEEEFNKISCIKPYSAEDLKVNKPKCPTCGSTNVNKISTTSKVVGATMFGLFSKTARSQFKCNSCGYKW